MKSRRWFRGHETLGLLQRIFEHGFNTPAAMGEAAASSIQYPRFLDWANAPYPVHPTTTPTTHGAHPSNAFSATSATTAGEPRKRPNSSRRFSPEAGFTRPQAPKMTCSGTPASQCSYFFSPAFLVSSSLPRKMQYARCQPSRPPQQPAQKPVWRRSPSHRTLPTVFPSRMWAPVFSLSDAGRCCVPHARVLGADVVHSHRQRAKTNWRSGRVHRKLKSECN
jgi:hypothetical protein